MGEAVPSNGSGSDHLRCHHSKCPDCIFRFIFCIWLFLTGETNGSSVDDEVETSVEDGVRLHPDPNHRIGPHLRGLLPGQNIAKIRRTKF